MLIYILINKHKRTGNGSKKFQVAHNHGGFLTFYRIAQSPDNFQHSQSNCLSSQGNQKQNDNNFCIFFLKKYYYQDYNCMSNKRKVQTSASKNGYCHHISSYLLNFLAVIVLTFLTFQLCHKNELRQTDYTHGIAIILFFALEGRRGMPALSLSFSERMSIIT